jgi:hypothetical protein
MITSTIKQRVLIKAPPNAFRTCKGDGSRTHYWRPLKRYLEKK